MKDIDRSVADADPIDGARLGASWSTSDAKQALFQEISDMRTHPSTVMSSTPSRPARRSLVVVAAVAVLSMATVAGAATLLWPTTTSVACHGLDGGMVVIDAVTGDAVADCGAWWTRSSGDAPPELVAYDNGTGGVAVQPATAPVPDGWQPLASDGEADGRVAQLDGALSDHIDGLNATCLDQEAAVSLAEEELRRIGLPDWSVTTDRGAADGVRSCSTHLLDVDGREVVLVPTGPGRPPAELTAFANDVGERLDRGCMTAVAARAAVESAVADAGLDPADVVIQEVTDASAPCAAADIRIGGLITVTVRGPQ